jgi:hypothetical protein
MIKCSYLETLHAASKGVLVQARSKHTSGPWHKLHKIEGAAGLYYRFGENVIAVHPAFTEFRREKSNKGNVEREIAEYAHRAAFDKARKGRK